MTRAFHGFHRITVDPAVMAGKPCIRGMRVTVGMILGNLGAGASIEELLQNYPYIERDDVLESIRFGARLASEGYVSFAAIKQTQPDLIAGGLVTVEDERYRVRRLQPPESV